ncbi:MAG: type 1 glutamine amidotransferase domain-containing protein [Pseudomonadota bacterium]
MSIILIPLPSFDFDPTETAVPWQILTGCDHEVRFATPDGKPAQADARMLHGSGLGPWKELLRADDNGRAAYASMIASPEFMRPLSYDQINIAEVDAIGLPGGHAAGMKTYLESHQLQATVAAAFTRQLPVGAICHGVILAARSRGADGRSVLHGRRTTALTRTLELSGWALTALWLGNYYRTYPITVQEEVTRALAHPNDFQEGPMALLRDSPTHLERGFVVRDGNYLSARWPGDAHRFAHEFAAMLDERV